MAITISGSGITSANIADGTIVSGDIADGTIVNADINSSAAIAGTKVDGSFGKVLQVVSVTKTDTFTTTSTSFTDVTGLSVSITPSSTSSKIMVLLNSPISNTGTTWMVYARILRGSTVIAAGDAAGSRRLATVVNRTNANNSVSDAATNYLDSPATTSAVTYKMQLAVQGNTGVVNRTGDDANADTAGRMSSSITLMEIGV